MTIHSRYRSRASAEKKEEDAARQRRHRDNAKLAKHTVTSFTLREALDHARKVCSATDLCLTGDLSISRGVQPSINSLSLFVSQFPTVVTQHSEFSPFVRDHHPHEPKLDAAQCSRRATLMNLLTVPERLSKDRLFKLCQKAARVLLVEALAMFRSSWNWRSVFRPDFKEFSKSRARSDFRAVLDAALAVPKIPVSPMPLYLPNNPMPSEAPMVLGCGEYSADNMSFSTEINTLPIEYPPLPTTPGLCLDSSTMSCLTPSPLSLPPLTEFLEIPSIE